jgi:hypothetical protein
MSADPQNPACFPALGFSVSKEDQVGESIQMSGGRESKMLEFSSAVTGFDVVDRNGERVGSVHHVTLGRTCILVDTGRSLMRRKQKHAVHAWAVREIDLDMFTISLTASKEEVAGAPEFHELDEETSIARYYYDRLAAHGERVDADAWETRRTQF